MTKQQLLDELAGKDFVDALIGDPVIRESKSNGDKWYSQNIREVNGKRCTYRNIHFYVVGESSPKEVAYYKEQEPKKQITDAVVAQ